MQSSTGQYSTQAGDPAHPVQHSVITANSFGFFLRGVARPLDFGSHFSSSGTIPTALVVPGTGGICVDYNLNCIRPKMILAVDLRACSSFPPALFCYSEPRQRSTDMAGKSLNRVQLIGNLGKDPEVKFTPQGTPVAKLTIATNER